MKTTCAMQSLNLGSPVIRIMHHWSDDFAGVFYLPVPIRPVDSVDSSVFVMSYLHETPEMRFPVSHVCAFIWDFMY